MAKDLDPRCKKCRREGEKLFLKGERCLTPKCSVVRRNYPPGTSGVLGNTRLSQYGIQLREKQKAKRIYNILEKQLRNYYIKASRKRAKTGEGLIELLESRLDNVVYRLSFAKSRNQAREIINHGHILVNDKKVDISSYLTKVNDEIKINPNSLKRRGFENIAKNIAKDDIPGWLELNIKNLSGKVIKKPSKDDSGYKIDTNLIVEYYSR
jgi:small subunit ribosomal protein S4